jgi:hypothetical protein
MMRIKMMNFILRIMDCPKDGSKWQKVFRERKQEQLCRVVPKANQNGDRDLMVLNVR